MQLFIYKRISYIFILERLFLIRKKIQNPTQTKQTNKKTPQKQTKEHLIGKYKSLTLKISPEKVRLAPGWDVFTEAGPASAKHSSASISSVHSSGKPGFWVDFVEQLPSKLIVNPGAGRNLIKPVVREHWRKPSALHNNNFYWSHKTQQHSS